MVLPRLRCSTSSRGRLPASLTCRLQASARDRALEGNGEQPAWQCRVARAYQGWHWGTRVCQGIARLASSECRRTAAAGCLSAAAIKTMEKTVQRVEGELRSRRETYGDTMKQIREEWDAIGYVRQDGDELEDAIATHRC